MSAELPAWVVAKFSNLEFPPDLHSGKLLGTGLCPQGILPHQHPLLPSKEMQSPESPCLAHRLAPKTWGLAK